MKDMKAERSARLKAAVGAGLLAGCICFGIVWLFGYITGYRMAFPLLGPISVIVAVITGAQAFVVGPDDRTVGGKSATPTSTSADPNDPLAQLQKQAEERARRR